MLTTNAFNALLKTLEEPPPYVRFVLATTEPHRIPATVLSRSQRFDFRRIPAAEIALHLGHIAMEEGFEVQEAAVNAIARSAQGCMRDAVSLLDQMTSFASIAEGVERPVITLEQIHHVLGSVAQETVAAFVDLLAAKDVAAGLQLIHELLLKGGSLHEFAGQVVDHLRGVMVMQMVGDGELLDAREPETVQTMKKQAGAFSKPETLRAIKLFSEAMTELKGGHQPQLPLELALIEVVQGVPAPAPASTPAEFQPQPALAVSPPPPSTKPVAVPAATPALQAHTADTQTAAPLDADAMQRLRGQWDQFLLTVRERCGPKEQASLRSIKDLAIGGDSVALAFGNNSFTRDVISEVKTKDAVAAILAETLGRQVSIICQSGDKATVPLSAGRAAEEVRTSGPDPLIEYAVSELGAEVNDKRS